VLCKSNQVENFEILIGEALEVFNRIDSSYFQDEISVSLVEIANELAELKMIEDSLEIARIIPFNDHRFRAIMEIAIELSKQGNWTLSENVSFEITDLATRHSCWQTIALEVLKKTDWKKAIESGTLLKSTEAQAFYKKGWANAIGQIDMNDECINIALPLLIEDSETIELVLQKYAVREIVYGNLSKDRLNRLNRTLNMQWLLDITAQFSENLEPQRLSTNIDVWLHQIEDEEVRDKIEFWAYQVSKGKISEDEFLQKVNEEVNQ
jgi:hypothetical protein